MPEKIKSLAHSLGLEADKQHVLERLFTSLGPLIAKVNRQQPKSLRLIAKIAAVSTFAEKASDTSDKIVTFIDAEGLTHAHHTAQHISADLHVGTLILSVINFIRIPSEYLYAWIRGEKIETTLAKNARWVQAGLLLALGITAFAIPVIGPALGLGAAFIGLGATVISLANLYYEKMQLNENLDKTLKAIRLQDVLEASLEKRAKAQLELLEQALEARNNDEVNELIAQMTPVVDELEACKTQLISLYAEKALIEYKLSKKGRMAVIDRAVGIGLSSLAIIGLTTLFIAPLVGIAIIATVAVSALLYTVGRMVAPAMKNLFSWIGSLFKSKPEALIEHAPEIKPELTDQNLETDGYGISSDAEALSILSKPGKQSNLPGSKQADIVPCHGDFLTTAVLRKYSAEHPVETFSGITLVSTKDEKEGDSSKTKKEEHVKHL